MNSTTQDIEIMAKEKGVLEVILFGLAAIGGTLLAAELIKTFSKPKTVYRCPNCNGAIEYKNNPCPHCKINLEWNF